MKETHEHACGFAGVYVDTRESLSDRSAAHSRKAGARIARDSQDTFTA